MKSLKKERRRKLGKVLIAAYRNCGQQESGDAWETRVMNSVRNMPPVSTRTAWPEMLGSLFWQLCPVACAIIIFLAIAIFHYDILAEQDLARIVIDDINEVTLLDPDNG
jgi:hypothetical protein